MNRKPHRISVRTSDRRVREILHMRGDYQTTVAASRSLHTYLPDNSWKGQRCFIIGGGPSLQDFDFDCLKGEKVIAINRAYLDCPFADLMFFMDFSRFYKWVMNGKFGNEAKQAFINFQGLKVYVFMKHEISDVLYVPRAGRAGIPISLEDGIHHGTNSGYGALQIALLLGASPIYLLGFDMKHEISEKGKEIANYHRSYPEQPPESTTFSFSKALIELSVDLATAGHPAKIINLNPDSALRCFQFKEITDIL